MNLKACGLTACFALALAVLPAYAVGVGLPEGKNVNGVWCPPGFSVKSYTSCGERCGCTPDRFVTLNYCSDGSADCTQDIALITEPTLLAAEFKARSKSKNKRKYSKQARTRIHLDTRISTLAKPTSKGDDEGIPLLNQKVGPGGSEKCDCKQVESGVWVGEDCVVLDSSWNDINKPGMVNEATIGCPP